MNEVQRHYNQRRKRLRQRDPIFYLASDKDFFFNFKSNVDGIERRKTLIQQMLECKLVGSL